MIRRLILVLALPLCAIGCGKGKNPVDKMVMVDSDDAKMNAAIAQAKATLAKFTTALKTPKAGQAGFSIKVPFMDKGKTEHIWLAPVTYDGKKFTGAISNVPELVGNVRMGQSTTVEPERVSDWMYIENGKLVGGYTIRAMRDAMPPKEREELDKGMPFKID